MIRAFFFFWRKRDPKFLLTEDPILPTDRHVWANPFEIVPTSDLILPNSGQFCFHNNFENYWGMMRTEDPISPTDRHVWANTFQIVPTSDLILPNSG